MQINSVTTTNGDSSNEKKYIDSTKESKELHNLSNESDDSSELEFNFKKHITDNFETENKGLFKLSFSKKMNSRSNSINDNEDNESSVDNAHKKNLKFHCGNNKIVESEILEQDETKSISEDKDEIITKLKRDIVLLTKKYEEKLNNIEKVEKNNFQLEQIYKNKYYIDIKKEKKKMTEIRSEKEMLLKKLYYYSDFFQKLKKKIRYLLRNTRTVVELFGTTENIHFLLKNVKDISLFMESMECGNLQKNKYRSKEKSTKFMVHNSENVKNENIKKENINPIKQLRRLINPSSKKINCPSNYTIRKKEKIQNVCSTNKGIYLRNDSFLKYYEGRHSQNKNRYNLGGKKKNALEHQCKIKKSNYEKFKNPQINNTVNSKKKNKITNFTIRLKNISPQNSDNILNLLRKTRKINYLLKHSMNVECDKWTNYLKGNIKNVNYRSKNNTPGKTR
ncbi:conserved Plasmodium protein, unknown function [Plasmodium ovale wallikeri]|uniref:Uncharacterized protein n=2 Tax=Plasmodium ovale TaxID=36330 RepID=A0A1C3KQW7_PLAOA|nr:conserved Plasmodium protein, unknown function [Plasmodium ovale wallikeri]SBT76501.1 conserved Plasmodium protein, unknown function [Plasmodium ovale]